VQALELEDQSFDLVVAACMLYQVPDLDRGLREIVRARAPELDGPVRAGARAAVFVAEKAA
jgi:ubiquinone/menaquinone biosynthesis C-methylase UbiE